MVRIVIRFLEAPPLGDELLPETPVKSGILDSGWSHDGQLDQKLLAVLIQMLMTGDSSEA